MKTGLLIIAALVPLFAAVPAPAQQRMLTIFGDDKCPSDTICVVGDEKDRYRIPKFLREPAKTPASQSWAVRQEATLSEGKSGQGSCSASGAGGWTGCWNEYMKAMREEAAAQKAANNPDIPR